jgi:hypothetical protein
MLSCYTPDFSIFFKKSAFLGEIVHFTQAHPKGLLMVVLLGFCLDVA